MTRSYYAVRVGRKRGIYKSWEEARAQVHAFAGAKHKRFDRRADAEAFLRGEEPATPTEKSAFPTAPSTDANEPVRTASYSQRASRTLKTKLPPRRLPPVNTDARSAPIVRPPTPIKQHCRTLRLRGDSPEIKLRGETLCVDAESDAVPIVDLLVEAGCKLDTAAQEWLVEQKRRHQDYGKSKGKSR